jgi:hypothetical protein
MGALDQIQQSRGPFRGTGQQTYQAGDSSPFLRAAELAIKKQNADRADANAQLANRLREDANKLRALEIRNKLIAEQAKVTQRMAVEADLAMFWKEFVEAQKASEKPDPTGAISAEFHRAVLLAAARHPEGTNDPQIKAMLVYHAKELDKHDMATQAAHAAIGRVMANRDLTYEERKDQLNSVAEANPKAFKDSGVQKRFFESHKEIDKAQEKAAKEEAELAAKTKLEAMTKGMPVSQVTSNGVTWKAPDTGREVKSEIASLEKERKLSVDQFAKARAARTRAGAILESALKTKNQSAISAANDLVKAADADINEWELKRDEAESALKSRVASKVPVQPQSATGSAKETVDQSPQQERVQSEDWDATTPTVPVVEQPTASAKPQAVVADSASATPKLPVAESASEAPEFPDITQDDYTKLKAGDSFYYKGKKLIKR